jgi:uroporphyrinogen decarboxylase
MEEMDSRERMLAAMNLQPVDRVPTDIWAVGEVWQKLKDHFGGHNDILAALHIDGMASVGAEYTGPPLPEVPEEHTVDCWGIQYRSLAYETGIYYEQSVWPLAEATTIDDLERYEWPLPDWFDYSKLHDAALAAREKQVVLCGYMTIFYMHLLLRGLEQSLVDPHDDSDFTHHLLNRVSDFLYEYHRRMFEAADGLIDVAQVTDDFGSQSAPMISLQTFRTFYRPHMERFIGLCRERKIKVFHHDDGAIRPFLPDLVEMGIDILNPVQSACQGMEMDGLKRDFGDRLCFHGGIDNQNVLPFGTPDDVRAAVRAAIDALAGDGTGYILAPCHNIQAVTPIENILAMYDEAWQYGRSSARV